MTWPNTTVSTTNLDAGSDRPSLARADLKDAVDRLNTMITDGPTRGFVEILFTSTERRTYFPSDPPSTRYRANVQSFVNFGPNVVNRVTDNGEFEISSGTYMFNFPPTNLTVVGEFALRANVPNDLSFTLTSATDGTVKISDPLKTIFTIDSTVRANVNSAIGTGNPVRILQITRLA